MFCQYCGAEISGEEKFCQSCGARIDGVETVTSEPVTPQYAGEKKEPMVWTVFARIGFGFSIATLVFCWLVSVSSWSGPIGLVFSILGGKSSRAKGLSKAGITISIIGMVISLIFMIVFIAAIIEGTLADLENANGYYGDYYY